MSAADVLAVLTDDARDQVVRSFATMFRRDVTLDAQGWRAGPLSGRWTVEATAEAVEVLATRGLWPWAPGDDASPRWWCEVCDGTSLMSASIFCAASHADPPTLAALVAVASLGAPTLLRAEELARVLVGREPRIVWRVMPREALARWSQVGDGRPVATAPQTIPQAACVARERWQSGDHWNGPSPWWLHDAPADVAAAWPAVRDLAAVGLHVVALDGDRITLAVEAL